ncbi:MAG: ATP-binding protein [Limisphaerales bacterium]
MGTKAVILKNDLSELGRLAEVTEQFGAEHHWPAKATYAVNLSLDEAVTNVISYGYDDAAEHLIQIRFSFEDRQLTVAIEDDGRPFNPLDQAGPDLSKPLEQREPGGLGVFLVRKMMDHVEYHRRADRNVLIMKKRIKPSLAGEETRGGNR